MPTSSASLSTAPSQWDSARRSGSRSTTHLRHERAFRAVVNLHEMRLAAYWAEALGGPASYSDSYGDETSVVRIHSGNGPHEEMDRRAIACFDQAMHDVGLEAAGPLRQVLHDYFAWATTTTMSRYPRLLTRFPRE
jgi:truncated hemoglobin YjbI